MSITRWKLASFLAERSLSAYALAKISLVKHPNTIYRIARLGHEPTRVDLPTLTAVLDGLRKLTGENVQLSDILEYDPVEAPEPQAAMVLPPEEGSDSLEAMLEQLRLLNLTESQLAAFLERLQAK